MLSAEHLERAISFTLEAHARRSRQPKLAVRYWDRQTPYAVHPIWCAMTLLSEPALPAEVRVPGALALLYHDVLEDTTAKLPDDTPEEVVQLVHELTFRSFDQEVVDLWSRSDTAKLLKLYDKASNLLDAVDMRPERRSLHREHARKLCDFVERRYGGLNIVHIARALLSAPPPRRAS
jgi:hypothetical protein